MRYIILCEGCPFDIHGDTICGYVSKREYAKELCKRYNNDSKATGLKESYYFLTVDEDPSLYYASVCLDHLITKDC